MIYTRKLRQFCTGQVLLVALLLLAVQPAKGQSFPGVVTFPNSNDDFKHYSVIEATPGGTAAGEIMVGTRFTNGGAGSNPNYTHFARVSSGSPAISVWKYLQETSTNCVDERSVHIAADNSGSPGAWDRYYLTSLVRFDDNGFFRDCIKIYAVDADGDLQTGVPNEAIIRSNDLGENLYPMHSLFLNGYLYICGYVLAGNSLSLPDQGPTYIANSYSSTARWDKQAFVMKVDLSTLTVAAYTKMDYSFQYAGFASGVYPNPFGNAVNQPSPESDFDMAVRMTLLPSGNIHVTGSVNAISFFLGAPLSAVNVWNSSAVMNVVIDPTTFNILHDKPFRMELLNGNGWNEAMGIGIVPATTINLGPPAGFFLVGNHYTPEIWLPTYGDLGGYSPVPHYPFVVYLEDVGGNPEPIFNTNLDAYATYAGGPTPANANPTMMSLGDPSTQGGYWAVNLVDCPGGLYCNLNAPNTDPQQVLWINGYRGAYSSNNYEVTTSKMNVAYDITNARPTGQSAGTYYETQLSNYQMTTGADPTGPITVSGTLVPNNFFALGLGLSNMMWSPTFSTRLTGDDIVIAGPKWNPIPGGTGKLNVKLIRAAIRTGTTMENDNLTDNCASSHDVFNYDTVGRTIIEPHGIDMDLVINYTTDQFNYPTPTSSISTIQQAIDYCEFPGNGDYKPAGVEQVLSITNTKVYPNPAGNSIYILPAKRINQAQQVEVVLLNQIGQRVAVLYSGLADGLGSGNALPLPDVANGLYMIQLHSNGQLLHNEKLSIQH